MNALASIVLLGFAHDVFGNMETVFRWHNQPQFLGQAPDPPFGRSGTIESHRLITLAIHTDSYPQDIGFTLSAEGVVYATQLPGFLFEPNSLFFQPVQVVEDKQYKLSIVDSHGDGLFDPGYVAVYYGSHPDSSEEIVTETIVSQSNTDILFFVGRHDRVSGLAGTLGGSAEPFVCVTPESDASVVLQSKKDFTPRFGTDKSVFPGNSCEDHANYVDCTNDRSTDCQWHFLAGSLTNGICRVDPISACIANGNCICETKDFKGGTAELAGGILFHAPISITSRNIGPATTTSYEVFTPPAVENIEHPQNDSTFISRTDFTNRVLFYEILQPQSELSTSSEFSVAFKLNYLYMDVPIVGKIWTGMGMTIEIDTTRTFIDINGKSYQLPSPLKKWTCTSIVVTSIAIHIGATSIERQLSEETAPGFGPQIQLGPFSAQLFDVRVYKGTLSRDEMFQIGSRCASPSDPGVHVFKDVFEGPYYTRGCDQKFDKLHAGEGGPLPTDGIQTYGSGPFQTLWIKPRQDSSNPDVWINVPEGEFDEELFFQQFKIQEYIWERYLFDIGMISFKQSPQRMVSFPDEVPKYSASFWNNPCRYMHNFNYGWQFPIYDNVISKWSDEREGGIFDISLLRGERLAKYSDMNFVGHEIYHGFQGNLNDVFSSSGSAFLLESSASFAGQFVFPGALTFTSPLTIAPGYPLGFDAFLGSDVVRGQHFLSEALSLNELIRGGHLYASWVMWWFLSEHVGLPNLLGNLFANANRLNVYTTGELFYVRQEVQAAGYDFGDVWSTCIAHMRTWDFPIVGEIFMKNEQIDFEKYKNNRDVQPFIPVDATLESRKTAASIDPEVGTGGQFLFGPAELLPGPNGWNSLTMTNVAAGKRVSITVNWNDGMGFAADVVPSFLPNQHEGCDEDPRFYNSVVVVHDMKTNQRRYWKLKGKAPATLNVPTGIDGPVTLHILLVPTPPADYIFGVTKEVDSELDTRVGPIPIYNYKYKVEVSDLVSGDALSPETEVENGIMKLENGSSDWWPVACTCLEDPNAVSNRCARPVFETIDPNKLSRPPSKSPTPLRTKPQTTSQPSPSPTTQSSSAPSFAPVVLPTEWPTVLLSQWPSATPTLKPTPFPSLAQTTSPTFEPTPLPTLVPTEIPTLSPSLAPLFPPTEVPTQRPSPSPTPLPTEDLSPEPSSAPVVLPTEWPTVPPSRWPTPVPTLKPTPLPSLEPTTSPTFEPSPLPTLRPTANPTPPPSQAPVSSPTNVPTLEPSPFPTHEPTEDPTPLPSLAPMVLPTEWPTIPPSRWPTSAPTPKPTLIPSSTPTTSPTFEPTPLPTLLPTENRTPLVFVVPVLPPTKVPTLRLSPLPTHSVTKEPFPSPLSAEAPICLPSVMPTFTVPTAVPTSASSLFCDDDNTSTFWVPSIKKFQKCIWLAARPEEQATLCQPSHQSAAFHKCAETCGKCHDSCEDTSGIFEYDSKIRDCLWLSLRPSIQETECVEGSPVMAICPETCNVCDGNGSTTGPPSASPSSKITLKCDDSKVGTFFVAAIAQEQSCVWLAARPEYHDTLCSPDDPSRAYQVCAETCGACVDNCMDSDLKFNVDEDRRDCLWLSLRPSLQNELCRRQDVRAACPETCDTCDELA